MPLMGTLISSSHIDKQMVVIEKNKILDSVSSCVKERQLKYLSHAVVINIETN